MANPLSVVVIARNEVRCLTACLDSAAFADEILVVDSGSQDGTQDLARSWGARLVEQPFLGYGRQKQFAVEQAGHDWVLSLDADERVTPTLAASIHEALAAPAYTAYRFARCNHFMGRPLRHGEGYPDWSLRLFHRAHARWSEDPVHEAVIASGPVGTLRGDLDHRSEQGLAEYLDKQNLYTTLQAERLYARGASVSAATLVLSPLLRFVRLYVVRRGFLDGVPGLVHIGIGCFNSFVKYVKLMELHRRAGGAP